MRGVAGEIQPAVSVHDLTREILTVWVEYQQGERDVEAGEKAIEQQTAKVDGIREKQRVRARMLGERLLKVKANTPHGGWLAWLGKTGIPERTAQEWMAYVERSKSATNENVADMPVKERDRQTEQNTVNIAERVGDTTPDAPDEPRERDDRVEYPGGSMGRGELDVVLEGWRYLMAQSDPQLKALAAIIKARLLEGLRDRLK